jgi:hypothetical protein
MDDEVLTDEQKQAIWAEADRAEAGQAAAVEPAAASETTTADEAAHQDAAPADQAGANDAAAESDAADDPFAGMSPAAKAHVLGLENMLKQASQRLRNAEGRIGGLTSQLQQLATTARSVTAEGGDAPSASQLAAAQAKPGAMARLLDEYPEFGAAFKEAMQEQLATQPKPQAMPEGVVTASDLESFRSRLLVESAHPGWEERVQTPAFQGWLTQQPAEIQQLAASDSPQSAIRLLNLHKESSTRQADPLRQQRQAASAAIPSGRSAGARARDPDNMTPDEYWRYLDTLDKSK